MVTITATDRSPAKNTSTTTVTVTGRPTTVFRYDADGNLLDDGLRSYTWDAANRLASVTVKPGVTLDGLTPGTYAFGYNAAGQRVSETVNGTLTRRWVWEPGAAAPAAELNAAGTVALRRYYAAGEVRLEAQAAGLTPRAFYYTRDHLGSVREVLDHTGATVAAYDYDAYGRRTTVTGGAAVGSEFGYTGHLTHASTGLVLTLYRAYDPETGRWLSRDPIWESGGMNLYGYVGGSPLMGWDEFGLSEGDWWDPRTYRPSNWTGAGDAVVASITNPKYVKCSANAIINGMVSQVPYAGTLASMAGAKANLFESGSAVSFGNYDTVDGSHGGMGLVNEIGNHAYKNLGGDAQLAKYSNEAARGVLGKRPMAALGKLSNLNFANKALGRIGIGTGLIDMLNDISDCDKCKGK